jgi:prepilin-type N-terminal cleavage/methylation domain-containing protein
MHHFFKQMKSTASAKQGVPGKALATSGFTLVELLVSLALFTVIVVAAIGSLYTVNDASRRVNAMRTVLDNINFATEAMGRTIRTSHTIACGGVENVSGQPNCAFSSNNGQNKISMIGNIDNQGTEYRYQLDGVTGNGLIQRCLLTNGQIVNAQCVALTAPEVNITALTFFVDGANVADGKQPSVVMMIQGIANAGTGNTAPFFIQTYISQRAAE